MRKLLLSLISVFLFSSLAIAGNGIITIKSSHDVKVTADRLEKNLKMKGMTVFTRINYAAGAQKVGKKLRPTELIIFGNPKLGTLLMQCEQIAGIDLPQKALIWKDGEGQVWLSYNDPLYLTQRHGLKGCDEVSKKLAQALSNFSQAATKQ